LPWVRLDEHALNHVKILALSHGAFRLWVEGLAHCQKHLTDGAISRASLRGFRYAARARVSELTEAIDGQTSLWEPTTDGFQVHDYLAWNESREYVLKARAKAKARMDRLRGVCSREQQSEHGGERTQNERGTTTTTTTKGSSNEEPGSAADEADAFAALWNEETTGPIPRCRDLTPKRRKQVRARLKERDVSDWRPVMARIQGSAFCRGENDRGWVATFDWLVGSPDVAVKVLEGKYDDRAGKRAAATTRPQPASTASDWWEECKAIHDGTCTKRWDHETRKRQAS
jgi:hypothetical protein